MTDYSVYGEDDPTADVGWEFSDTQKDVAKWIGTGVVVGVLFKTAGASLAAAGAAAFGTIALVAYAVKEGAL